MTTVEHLEAVQRKLEALQAKIDAIENQQKVSRANTMLLVAVLIDHLADWL